MRSFRLIYLGKIPSNGSSKDKHKIRLVLHRQLVNLWKSTSISIQAYPAEKHVGGFFLVPFVARGSEVSTLIHNRVELDILMLKPRPRGVISQGGDIDNQMKTLLDALCVPNPDQLPAGASPPPGADHDDPFFCLLEDDSQVETLNVSVDRLLVKTHAKRAATIIRATEFQSPHWDAHSSLS